MPDAKIFVVYDERGQIKATAVAASEQMRVRGPGNLNVHVIDIPKSDRENMPQYLLELHRDHFIQAIGEARVVMRRSRKKQ